MLKLVRSAVVKNGKLKEGIELAKEIATHINTVRGDNQKRIEVWMEVGNAVGRIHWTGQYDNWAEFEGLQNKLLADDRFMARVTQTADVYIEGSISDLLMTSVP
jgi:hypothetical protein